MLPKQLLLCVFPKRRTKYYIMIEEFIDSALIIDDKFEEVENLKTHLESKDIWVKHLFPRDIESSKAPVKNRKVIFLDLFISETSKNLKGNIAEIRNILSKIIGKEYGAYGIILWSAHIDEINELKQKIQLDTEKYTLPIFIVGLDKTKYKRVGNYDSVINDLNTVLNSSNAAKFFMLADTHVRKGKDFALNGVFSLSKSYENQDSTLSFILFNLARNYTGIPITKIDKKTLESDLMKSYSDLLSYYVSNIHQESIGLFSDWENIKYKGHDIKTSDFSYSVENLITSSTDKKKVFKNDRELTKDEKKNDYKDEIELIEDEIISIHSEINRVLLIDNANVNKQNILPGYVYEIIKSDSPFISDDIPEGALPIIIEVTPPCDFSQNKLKKRRIIGGFLCDFSRKALNDTKPEYYYREIWPIRVNEGSPSLIVFDFRYFGSVDETILLDEEAFKFKFRVKDKLFADVLQKLATHTARLGLSVIH